MRADVLPGDCRETLATLPAESVQCCVTSPPYFGLRDYGTAQWDGGDPDCSHTAVRRGHGENEKQATSEGTSRDRIVGGDCRLCGARRIDSQIGLESSPAEFVAQMVAVFREVRRVLKDDGVLWLNLGDSYAAARGGTHQPAETLAGGKGGKTSDGERVNRDRHDGYNPTRNAHAIGLKHKDLIGIPWRVAFALQADGWYLRQDIIWHKPNPMPESVRDRCTKAHEYVFLLSKSERYFYDADAISERASSAGTLQSFSTPYKNAVRGSGHAASGNEKEGAPPVLMAENRNRRSVWSITSEPYPEAHFATFPTELPRLCILAGSRVGDTILDPFAGSGTTLQVALELGRQAIGCELNPEYCRLIEKRLSKTTIGLPLEMA